MMLVHNLQQFHEILFFRFYTLLDSSPLFSHIIYVIAEVIDWWVVGIAVIFVAFHVHRHARMLSREHFTMLIKEGIGMSSAILVAWGVSYIMKQTFALPRPFLVFDRVTPLFEYGGYDSFPSGHATLFMALATMIALRHKGAGLFFIICALAISLARVIAGVHFPVDIFVGWIFGILIPVVLYKNLKI